MQYRLLRNNKESGPYTKAQLEDLGLKPYDLLWIEGRGGAWQYASEIDDLKSIAPVVEEQPYDRFYKGKEKATTTTTVSSRQVTSFTNNAAETGTATLKPPKPRIRISGDKVVMIDNAALQQPQPITNVISSIPKEQTAVAIPKPAPKQEAAKVVQGVGLHWENMYEDWKGEEVPVAEKPAPANVQTIEEVKQRYEESKLKHFDVKNHTKSNPSAVKQNIMAGVAILVLAIGGYAGYKLNESGATNRTQATPIVEKAEVVQGENSPLQNSDEAALNTTTTAQQTTSNNTTAATTGEIKSTLPAAGNTAITPASTVENKSPELAEYKKEANPPAKSTTTVTPANTIIKPEDKTSAVEQQTSATAKSNTATTKENKEEETPYTIRKPNVSAPVQATPATEAPEVKHEAPKKNIKDVITVSKLGNTNTSSVQNVLLSVKNVSDFPVDLAVIDIQYYDANGRYQKGETMYVKNIGAGNNVNVRIPDGKTARTINYKVSLVSSEQKTLYLVGE